MVDCSGRLENIMTQEDLILFSQMEQALWGDTRRADAHAQDTLAALATRARRSSSDGDDDFTDHAFLNLLENAHVALGAAVLQPFFRLSQEQRFLLVALHRGQWSYARVAKLLRLKPDAVEHQAWSARTALARDLGVAHPTGSPDSALAAGAHCPEYDLSAPWTQRFLDDEIGNGTRRLFLQNHAMACDTCRSAIERCRKLLYAVEEAIPVSPNLAQAQSLGRVIERSARLSQRSGWDILSRDVQWVILALSLMVIWKALH